MANTGWIKVQRNIDELGLMGKNEPYDKTHAYIDLMRMCNYEDKQFSPRNGSRVLTIHRGEFFTSYGNLAKQWNWSLNKVRGYLNMLQKMNLAHVKAHPFGICVTLEKYGVEGHEPQANGIANGISNGIASGTANGIANGIRLKKGKNSKESQEEQEPKNTAKRSGFDWGNLE